jgi:hypothetical protein
MFYSGFKPYCLNLVFILTFTVGCGGSDGPINMGELIDAKARGELISVDEQTRTALLQDYSPESATSIVLARMTPLVASGYSQDFLDRPARLALRLIDAESSLPEGVQARPVFNAAVALLNIFPKKEIFQYIREAIENEYADHRASIVLLQIYAEFAVAEAPNTSSLNLIRGPKASDADVELALRILREQSKGLESLLAQAWRSKNIYDQPGYRGDSRDTFVEEKEAELQRLLEQSDKLFPVDLLPDLGDTAGFPAESFSDLIYSLQVKMDAVRAIARIEMHQGHQNEIVPVAHKSWQPFFAQYAIFQEELKDHIGNDLVEDRARFPEFIWTDLITNSTRELSIDSSSALASLAGQIFEKSSYKKTGYGLSGSLRLKKVEPRIKRWEEIANRAIAYQRKTAEQSTYENPVSTERLEAFKVQALQSALSSSRMSEYRPGEEENPQYSHDPSFDDARYSSQSEAIVSALDQFVASLDNLSITESRASRLSDEPELAGQVLQSLPHTKLAVAKHLSEKLPAPAAYEAIVVKVLESRNLQALDWIKASADYYETADLYSLFVEIYRNDVNDWLNESQARSRSYELSQWERGFGRFIVENFPSEIFAGNENNLMVDLSNAISRYRHSSAREPIFDPDNGPIYNHHKILTKEAIQNFALMARLLTHAMESRGSLYRDFKAYVRTTMNGVNKDRFSSFFALSTDIQHSPVVQLNQYGARYAQREMYIPEHLLQFIYPSEIASSSSVLGLHEALEDAKHSLDYGDAVYLDQYYARIKELKNHL